MTRSTTSPHPSSPTSHNPSIRRAVDMESPYNGSFFLNCLSILIHPVGKFYSSIIWLSIFRLIETLLSPALLYDLLTCRIALCVGFETMTWPEGALEAVCICIARALPAPLCGLISTPTALVVIFIAVKTGVASYFLFQGTDEHNLALVMECTAPTAAFVVVITVPALCRLVWNNLSLALATSVIFTLFSTEPRLLEYVQEFVLVRWAGKAVFFILRWTVNPSFRAADCIAETMNTLMRNLEAWEFKISKNRLEALEPYTYRPLDPLKREIRILRLRRRNASPDIVCDFFRTTVDTAPPFEAVSYTWGGESMTENIVVDGGRVAVSPTVSKWLRYRRSFFSEAYLWIDAVCIDQANSDEKAAQIPLMGNIYTQATRTMVWLTHPADITNKDASSARSLLMTLNTLHLQNATTDQLRYVVSTEASIFPLQYLLSRSYFHRIWVIQEIALAKEVHLFFGSVTMDWEALAHTVLILHDARLAPSMIQSRTSSTKRDTTLAAVWATHISNMVGIVHMRRDCQGGEKTELISSLANTSSFTATAPHDNIFGLLGIADDLPASIVRPDYNEPVVELFARMTKHLLEKPSPVSLLQLAGTGFPYASRPKDLPSWVPDFSYNFNKRRIVYENRSILAMPTKSSEWNVLNVEIFSFDRIATIQARTCSIFEAKPVWEIDMDELQSGIPETPESENILQRDGLLSFVEWFDEAVSLAKESPTTLALYPGEIDLEVVKTMGCNSPEVLQDDPNGVLGVDRYRLALNVVRVMVRVYQECVDGYVGDAGERIRALCGVTLEEWASAVNPEMNQFLFSIGAMAGGKSLCILESGRMAMVPPGSRQGDAVLYIRGQRIPFVMRKTGMDDSYELVGGCYVHGVADWPSPGSIPESEWEEVSMV
ncbi:heterokaryon incompatibility protein-domain-containing protein [Plectosphaerella cucumerina]|uniref:Heterokaryon incompatibility protein-domain-containing protein n=1 Tax=Plectosphaerella cucumerina TaxID=40658 RepID=A0A8K0TRH6_9PEZI|nr:heterokaryon incompatibility protein-domain-containing protein [Plectosphaerella cucumerina]